MEKLTLNFWVHRTKVMLK